MFLRRLLLVSLVAISGCNAALGPIRGTGQPVEPPRGWVDYCDRHLDDADCAWRRWPQ